jgi:signal transduction histidine kinase/ActR/RegA family two-component response regulator
MTRYGNINMIRRVLEKLKSVNPWHYVWIVVLAAESLTFILSSLQSYVRWGYIPASLIEIAAVDAFVCSLILSALVVYLLKSVNDKLEREIIGHRLVITRLNQAQEELGKFRDHLQELVEERTEEVSVLNDQLRQSQKLEAVGLLAGGIAHDFSNILTTIKGSVYIIRKRLEEGSPLLKYADQVESSANKANNLSHSLLAFSRKQTFILQPLDLNKIIKTSVKLFAQVLGEHIELHLSLVPQKAIILADSNQMEQILLNLATNARDAMPDRGRLTIQSDIIILDDAFIKKHGFGIAGKYALLSVSDTGIGMGEGIKEKIFEPFFTTKESGKSSGLGLAVTYGIVKQLNGYIHCETVPKQGTTFMIYLPAVDAMPVQHKHRDVLSTSEGVETILLAEDDHDTRRTVSEVLRLSGYTVLEARDGEDAVNIHSKYKEQIDLAVLDVRMPKMNGRQVYDAIRSASSQTEVLFMSGYTDEIIDGEGILERGLNFISKAAEPDEILAKVREVLDKSRMGTICPGREQDAVGG